MTDDPEGAGVLLQCRSLRRALPAAARDRTHLACLPTNDVEENAIIVDALQRRADVVEQERLVERSEFTVTEATWKGRPVLASAVGDGLLLDDPHDLDAFAAALSRLLGDDALAAPVRQPDRQPRHLPGLVKTKPGSIREGGNGLVRSSNALRYELGGIHETGGVAPFVVIPAEHFSQSS